MTGTGKPTVGYAPDALRPRDSHGSLFKADLGPYSTREESLITSLYSDEGSLRPLRLLILAASPVPRVG